MIKPPYTKWINDIKTKLGFNRTMTASGEDVVDAVNKQADAIDEKADIPITVTVTVDNNGASMSAADRAKFTPNMRICSYNGDPLKLKENLIITPGNGTAVVTGKAYTQTVFEISFIKVS